MKKAAILGGGFDQKKLVQEFSRRGFQTILFDYYDNPPAKSSVNKHRQISTYDLEGVHKACKIEDINVIGTISTDQPLVTAAYVSDKMGLYHPLSYNQAVWLTNKEYMKSILAKNNIPTPKHFVVSSTDNLSEIKTLRLPLVVKPVDSSGSRGVSFINSYDDLESCCHNAIKHSRAGKIIFEEKVEGILVSVDTIIKEGYADVLLVIDNSMFNDKLGLFRKMNYPSSIGTAARQKIKTIVQLIASSFNLSNTPLFVQFIVSKNQDVYVLELSARIAGGSKPYLIPILSGVDIVKGYVSQLLQEPFQYNKKDFESYYSCNYLWCSKKGIISKIEGLKELAKTTIIEDYGLYKYPGDIVLGRENGSDRIGFFYVSGKTLDDIAKKVAIADKNIRIIDNDNMDIMLHGIYE